jgi:hypothetical protein
MILEPDLNSVPAQVAGLDVSFEHTKTNGLARKAMRVGSFWQ